MKHEDSDIIDIIADLALRFDCAIDPKARLIEDLKFDDLDPLELAMEIEGQYNVEVTDEEIAAWITVQDVVNTVHKLTDL